MITLKTGVPGASKTLSAVHELALTLGRQMKGKEETRPIYVHGVKDLTLPHFELEDGKEWMNCPEGAIVIIDEAQGTFPPRSSTSKAPPHVEALNTHRHRGIDLVVITQHPKLIDQAVRRLVGKHQHYRRLYGGKTSICYEWDHCEDSLLGIKTATKSMFRQPRDAYRYYKSAEIHTKQKHKVPTWLVAFPVAVVALAFYGGPTVARILSGKPAAEASAVVDEPGVLRAAAVEVEAAPALVQSGQGAPAEPIIAGCIRIKARCECIDSRGISIPVDYDRCMGSSERGGLLVPYNLAPVASTPAPARAAAPTPMPSEGAGAIALSTSYQPRNPVRDLSGTLAGSGGLPAAATDADGSMLAWMRQQ